jgi:S-adenosylmethionine decarboxylase
MLDLVHCKVLSTIETESLDSYLLSESSMFIFPHKLVLKTCGTTTLLLGLPRILEIAALDAGFPHTPADLGTSTLAAAPPYRVFYSRKNFLFPDQQKGPHRSWRDEVRTLDRLFIRGSAYMIGKMNGEHWYLYITEPDTRLTPPATPEHERVDGQETQTRRIELPAQMDDLDLESPSKEEDNIPDETLEILMTDLDVDNAKQFYLEHAEFIAGDKQHSEDFRKAKQRTMSALDSISEERTIPDDLSGSGYEQVDVFEQELEETELDPAEEDTTQGHALGSVISDACGLSAVYPTDKYPDARIDAYLFTPCGFSANGVIPAPAATNYIDSASSHSARTSTHYFTVHVTPEPECSYASFETNVPTQQTGRDYASIVEQVVGIFKPGRFSSTLFEAKVSREQEAAGVKKVMRKEEIKGYRRVDRIVHDLDGYELVFRYYERHDFRGGPSRLGEDKERI